MIKKNICFVLIIFFCGCLSGGNDLPETHRRHEGLWFGVTNDGKKVSLRLNPNGYAELNIDKQDISNSLNNKVYYVINYNTTPIWLDIIFASEDSESKVIKFNIEFLSRQIMRVWTNIDNNRPNANQKEFLMKKKL